jgi:hypothetical protein
MGRRSQIYREQEDKQIPGISLQAFIHNGPAYYLTDIMVYRDGMVDCWGLIDLDEFKDKVASSWVVTTLPEGAEVSISLLCGFHATNVNSFIKESEFVKEVEDEIERLNGRQTAFDRCYTAYENYNANPSESTRAALKVEYEAVPEHIRPFLGDMDVKDIPIRMIIYGDAELESWSHRVAARQLGVEPLPTITVRRPKDVEPGGES